MKFQILKIFLPDSQSFRRFLLFKQLPEDGRSDCQDETMARNLLASPGHQSDVSVLQSIIEGSNDFLLQAVKSLQHFQVEVLVLGHNHESRFLAVKTVHDLHHGLGMGLHHFCKMRKCNFRFCDFITNIVTGLTNQIRGILVLLPILVQDLEGGILQRLVIMQLPVNVHFETILNVDLLDQQRQAFLTQLKQFVLLGQSHQIFGDVLIFQVVRVQVLHQSSKKKKIDIIVIINNAS